jgi:hypothetical protein
LGTGLKKSQNFSWVTKRTSRTSAEEEEEEKKKKKKKKKEEEEEKKKKTRRTLESRLNCNRLETEQLGLQCIGEDSLTSALILTGIQTHAYTCALWERGRLTVGKRRWKQ